MKNKSTKEKLDAAFNIGEEHNSEFGAINLAYHFISLIDEEMIRQKMTKRELAQKVGTSPAYITQLFRADRMPNFKILAKMQEALGIRFEIRAKPVKKVKIQKTKASGKVTKSASKLQTRV